MARPARHSDPSIPRYRLTAKAYLNDIFYDPETMPEDPETGDKKPIFVDFEGVPGWHMEAANEAAREMKILHPSEDPDVLSVL
jgi:hypothetical protein